MGVPSCFKNLLHRMWAFNCLAKIIALSINLVCVSLWVTGVAEDALPANNHHELALFYHTVPAFNVILISLVFLYLVDEIPSVITQRVFVVTGFTLYLIVGTIGIQNTTDNDFPPYMLLMSVLCIAVAATLVVDFIKLENFFKPELVSPDVSHESRSNY